MSQPTATDMKVGFARRLRACREARGFSVQADFARRLGVDPKRYGHWESGLANPNSIALLNDICLLLAVTSDFLLFGQTRGLEPEAYKVFILEHRIAPVKPGDDQG